MIELNIEVPEEFLKEEVRNGYKVTRQMKEVWAVQLDLMRKLVNVCDKYGLRCFAEAGTLLGAVRHKGFIPWDDDIDMVMFREDYEKLLKVAENEFKNPYCFQSPQGKENYPYGHAQLRNVNTTGILKTDILNGYTHNLGIFIDIFIFDAVPNNEDEIRIERKKEIKWRTLAKSVCVKMRADHSLKFKIFKYFVSICRIPARFFHKKADKVLKKYSVDKYERVALLSFVFETEKRIRNKQIYSSKVDLPFEFLKIPAPANYHEFLIKRYGDYMKPAQIPTTHGEIILDASMPYTEYLHYFTGLGMDLRG